MNCKSTKSSLKCKTKSYAWRMQNLKYPVRAILICMIWHQSVIYTLEENGIIVEANFAGAFLFGLPREVLSGQQISRFIDKDSQDLWYIQRKNLIEEGIPLSFEIKMLRTDGETFWAHLKGSLYETPDSKTLFRIMLVDITERRLLESALKNEKQLFQTTLGSIGEGILTVDKNGVILLMNPVAERLTGWPLAEAIGKHIHEVFYVMDEDSRDRNTNVLDTVLKTGKPYPSPTHAVLLSKDGSEHPIEDITTPLLLEGGKVLGAVLGFRDVTSKIEQLNKIKHLSYHDQLTGLYNRRFFEEELQRIDTARNMPLTIVMGDVNGLKLINDSFGHVMGDELLKKVASAIRKGCREDEIIARLGGDEFVIILPKTNALMVQQIIQRIKDYANEDKLGAIDISISFGYDTKTSEEQDIHDIFRHAENSMYRHKLSESSSIRSKTIDVIMCTLFEKNNRELLHSKRVGKLSADTAAFLNFSEDDINQIRIAGMMHDIGKIGIDEKILNKPHSLNSEEWKEIERHSEIGYRILSSVNEFSEIADYILENHEQWNGKGYPRGLKHREISLQARIIAIADAFDAMTGIRSYGKTFNKEEAVDEIKRCSGTQFDPTIARIFVEKTLATAW
jgi:diguanylate cyclase